ncbi:MAG: hypothetical protein QOF39_2481, partial [Frankiales bacterium]|nr:hypothetical protein [Frankiales bacterium]
MAQRVRRLALERLLNRLAAAEVIELLGLEPMGPNVPCAYGNGC